jgi:hypothetical protein
VNTANGNPNEAAAYEHIRSYLPLDNITAQPYPASLIEVSLNDSQVPYWKGASLRRDGFIDSIVAHLAVADPNMGHRSKLGAYGTKPIEPLAAAALPCIEPFCDLRIRESRS